MPSGRKRIYATDEELQALAESFEEYKRDALKHRLRRDEATQKALLECLQNGGGDVIRRIFKESLNDIGIHNDDAKELREDFSYLRNTRKQSAKAPTTGKAPSKTPVVQVLDWCKTNPHVLLIALGVYIVLEDKAPGAIAGIMSMLGLGG